MSIESSILLVAIFTGATVQVGVGIGFSLIVAPLMMVLLGTTTAVPVLLALNTLVSLAAVDWRLWALEKSIIKKSVVGCLVGILLGSFLYPFFSEQFVLTLTATLLLFSVLAKKFTRSTNNNARKFEAISGFSGLATVWAATPGPLMVYGFLSNGYTAQQTRRLVQPVALVAYGVAFLLHMFFDWSVVFNTTNLYQFVIAALFGSMAGSFIGPKLPQNFIKYTISVISIMASIVLFHRAFVLE